MLSYPKLVRLLVAAVLASPTVHVRSTQTLPLAIYAQLDQDFDTALAIGCLLVLVSVAVLAAVKLLPSWRSTSPFRFAPSRSS